MCCCFGPIGAQKLRMACKIIRPMTAQTPLALGAKRFAQTGKKARVICCFHAGDFTRP